MASPEGTTGTQQLRVALLTNSLSPHTLALCENLSSQLREFHAFVSAASDDFHGFQSPQASFPITVQRSFNGLHLRYQTGKADISEQIHLPLDTLHHLFRFKPDVILSCQLGARTLFAILYCLVRPQSQLIIWAALSSETEVQRSRFRSMLRRWMFRHADAAFVNGASGAKYLRSLGFAGSIATVPYAIDDSLFRSETYEPSEQPSRLFYCGRIDPIKGVLRFYRIVERWCVDHPERRIHFDIVGGGQDSQTITSSSPPPNLHVTVRPRLDQGELAEHYHAADLFVLPSFLDEWAVVVNEAMSAGLPILGSLYSQAVSELVRDGENGWTFSPDDEIETYNKLHQALCTAPETLKRMSLRSRAAIELISPARVAARALEAIAGASGLPFDGNTNAEHSAKQLPTIAVAPL